MKAKVNIPVLAKPHPYTFFTLQLHSMFENYWLSDTSKHTDTEAGSYSSFPGHVGGARKWLENEATAVKLVNL